MALHCFALPHRTHPPRRSSVSSRPGRSFRSSRVPRVPLRRTKKRRINSVSENGGDGEPVDIDQLARQLSNAARRRRSLNQSPFAERKEDFDVDEFEIVQSLGYLSVKVTRPKTLLEDPSVSDSASNSTAVLAFVARYFSGKPYQYPVFTLLKEYLPPARAIAENEFRALMRLSAIPKDKWEVE